MNYALAENHKPDPKRRYLCRHIFTDGHRCGSPALRGANLCYYHRSTREQPSLSSARTPADSVHFEMPRIDDRAGLQLALYHVLARIACNEIDTKRAGLLLYGLQVASSNLPRQPRPTAAHALTETQTHAESGAHPGPLVEDYIHVIGLGDLAPMQELPTEESTPAPNPVLSTEAPQASSGETRIPPNPAHAEQDLQPPQPASLPTTPHPVLSTEAPQARSAETCTSPNPAPHRPGAPFTRSVGGEANIYPAPSTSPLPPLYPCTAINYGGHDPYPPMAP